jgi:GNAT superfamily N-acetyltransferase
LTYPGVGVLAECMNETQPFGPVLVRTAGPDDAGLLAELLKGLSAASSFHRFLAGLGVPNPALVGGVLRAEARRGAMLAVGRDAAGETAVGHACWSVSPDGVADVGVLVADVAQGRGIGTALFGRCLDAARGVGAHAVHLDVHPDNRRLVAALRRRFGGAALTWKHGQLSVDVPVRDALESDVVAAA